MPATYPESSAIVKLVIAEPGSIALRRFLRRRRPLVSSARTEVLRAVLLEGDRAADHARAALTRIDLVRLNDRLLAAARLLDLPTAAPA